MTATAPLNLIAGRTCRPVICRPKGAWFAWHDGQDWRQGDELPAEIAATLPQVEVDRCERHRWRRMADER
ncbi:MAG: hypothetical protein RLZZ127_1998 [Planctomycetota bacterium]|jgi:hypothetical protein